MIRAAVLVDIRGPKTVAALNLTRNNSYESLLDLVLEKYYEMVDFDGIETATVPVLIGDIHVCFSRISESLIVVGIPNEEVGDLDGQDILAVSTICDEFRNNIKSRPPGALADDFIQICRRHLQKTIRVCLISNADLHREEGSSQVLNQILQNLESFTGPYSRPISMGPYIVEIAHQNIEELSRGLWPIHLMHASVFVLFIEADSSFEEYTTAVSTIQSNSDSPVLAVAISDAEWMSAQAVAAELKIQSHRVKSSLPTDLLLTILNASGLTDVSPDVARSKWSIDTDIDRKVIHKSTLSTPKGHQAFVVVQKATGKPTLSYYYDKRSKILERAPNLVAAISSFGLEDMSSTRTSVFKAGDLNYIMIERNNLVFALITDTNQDVETLRERFSFLPDLYFDEMPGTVGPLDSPYEAPPFILKLLSVLPPVELSPRHVPFKIREPYWENFVSESVRDLLEAVWNRIDGATEISRLVTGNGPHLALGAIHLLKSVGAIGFRLNVQLTDIPYLVKRPSEDILQRYEWSEDILDLCGGMLTIEEIASVTGVEPRVLLVILSDLYARGQVNFVGN